MRTMLKFTIPVEAGNHAVKDGLIGKAVEMIMTMLKPEAAYFGTSGGRRGGMIFFDMTDSSQIAEFVEPLFLQLNAEVEFMPVMNADDLRKGLSRVKP